MVVFLEVESQTPETWCGFTIILPSTPQPRFTPTLQMLGPTIHPKSIAVRK